MDKGTVLYTEDNVGFVEIVDYMGTDLTHVNAARVSMGKRKSELDTKDEKLIRYLAVSEPVHNAPFRHAQMQFHVKAPEFVARQWYKHIIGCSYDFNDSAHKDTAWNEISGRYVAYNEFWQPIYFRQKANNVKQGSLDEVHPRNEYWLQRYHDHVATTEVLYTHMLEDGIAPEQARTILGLNVFTEYYWTASFQAVAHFVRLRNEEHAQKEIREYAVLIDTVMSELFPVGWEYRNRL